VSKIYHIEIALEHWTGTCEFFTRSDEFWK